MKKLIFFISIVCLSLTVNAQLLWKVSGNGLSKPSYVFGTHHIAPATFLDSIKGLNDAIDNCDIVYGEVAKDSLMSPESQAKMAQAMVAPDDSTLDKLYSPEGYNIIKTVFDKYFSSMGLTLEQMNKYKPIAISTQIEVLQAAEDFGDKGLDTDSLPVTDVECQIRAQAKGKKVDGLETVDYQMSILASMPIVDQAQDLLETCKKDDKFSAINKSLSDAYIAQDLDKILSIIEDPEMGTNEKELKVVLYDRNTAWVKKLKAIMPHQSVLVCVGAGHLPGDKGVLKQLRNAGFTVEPVK